MKTLVINTYGGSLLLGARALGLDIIGSYEDTGFGTPIQQANFPDLDFRPLRKDWPAQDLSETFVIAHPPCSAFSVQSNNPLKKGVDSAAFACTKSVIEYAVNNNALGLAIESVVGALAGAWHVHQYYADTYGYNLYRILENGTMWGAQWRDRYWSVYIKKGAAPDVMPWTLTPRFQTVQQVVTGYEDGPAPAGVAEAYEKLRRRFVDEAGCDLSDLEFIFGDQKEEMCSVDDRLWRRKFPTENRWEVCKKYVTKYASGAMVILDPDKFCPVLLGGSWWFLNGRNLSENGYKRLMGFPVDYIFPEGERRADNYRADFRTYLSKGVMPPIAEWVLEQATLHLGWTGQARSSLDEKIEPYRIECRPSQIADFRIRKKTWGEAHPALRHEDEVPLRKTAVTVTVTADQVNKEIVDNVKTLKPKKVKTPRPPGTGRTHRSPWNAPELETSLKETLFVRPNTADAYALYESHGYHRMGVVSSDVLLDLGAHIGCVASRAALLGAQVISVEAEAENFELLEQNTRSFQNVRTLRGAVYGGDAETVELHTTKRRDDSGHSTGTHSVLFKTQGPTVAVQRLDFRRLLAEHQPTVVKCDIEGSEFSLDWSNLPCSVRSIGIELHTRRDLNRDKAKELIKTLEDQGFKPVHALNMESNFSAIIAFLKRDTVTKAEV